MGTADGRPEVVDQFVAAEKSRRRGPRPWAERVLRLIHINRSYLILCFLSR